MTPTAPRPGARRPQPPEGPGRGRRPRPLTVAPVAFAPASGAATGGAADRPGRPPVPPVEPRLTVHAIDTYRGTTEAGLRLDLSYEENGTYRPLERYEALAGGRTKDPLLVGDELKEGRYEITLHLAEYFAGIGARLPEPPYLDEVPLRFTVADAAQRHHVAILFSPWNYSYYRGS
ncbi:hydroxyisourate hydrolase [Streptomyces diastatochromogenes]|nr:hydroxyisourate hydrolase [Streptomyces diastatochromogenes]